MSWENNVRGQRYNYLKAVKGQNCVDVIVAWLCMVVWLVWLTVSVAEILIEFFS